MWIDTLDEQAMRRLVALVQKHRQQNPQARVYALLDLAFCESDQLDHINDMSTRSCNLLQGLYAGEGLDRIDSKLVELPEPANESMIALMRLCAGRPMLSFILSSSTLEQLQIHLRQQLEAQDEQGDVFILRWADTRCLPTLHRCLNEPQRNRLMWGINAWLYPERDGEPQAIVARVQEPPPTHRRPVPFQLDAQQIQAIRAAARPDALLSLIASRPHLYGTLVGRPSLQHAVVRLILQRTAPPAHTADLLRSITDSFRAQSLIEE